MRNLHIQYALSDIAALYALTAHVVPEGFRPRGDLIRAFGRSRRIAFAIAILAIRAHPKAGSVARDDGAAHDGSRCKLVDVSRA